MTEQAKPLPCEEVHRISRLMCRMANPGDQGYHDCEEAWGKMAKAVIREVRRTPSREDEVRAEVWESVRRHCSIRLDEHPGDTDWERGWQALARRIDLQAEGEILALRAKAGKPQEGR